MWQIVVDFFTLIAGAMIIFLLCNHQLRITRLEKRPSNQRAHDEKLSTETDKEAKELMDMWTLPK